MVTFRLPVTGYVPVESQRGKTSGELVEENIFYIKCHRSLAVFAVHAFLWCWL